MFWIVGKEGMLAKAFQRVFKDKNLEYIASSHQECDVTNFYQVEKFASLLPIKTIINCSGYTNVDLAEKEVDSAFLLNEKGVLHLAQIAKKIDAKLIHFSTDYVFNGTKNSPYLETDLVSPLNIYGASKYAGELALQDRLPSSLIIRISWLFSKEMPPMNFTKKMVDLLQRKEQLEVVEDQISKVTYAEDLVACVLEMLDQEGVFHYANHGVISRFGYAQEILTILKELHVPVRCECILPVSSSKFSTPATRPPYSALDTTKIEKCLNKSIRHHTQALVECFLPRVS
jgi:dTDP-4-dehydrorhamnose reductase